MAALASAIVLPLLLWRGKNELASFCFWPCGGGTGGLVAAVIPVLWTYSGWDQLTHLAEEVRDPGRNLPRVLAAGMFTVAGLYLAVVVGIHLVLPYKVVAASPAVGADLFRALLGPAGTVMISVVIMLSALISANGAAMAGPRSCFAVARDGFGPAWVARVHPRFGTPANAVVLVGVWSAVLITASVALMVIPPPSGLPDWVRSLWAGLQTRPLFDVLISYVMFGYLGFQALVMVSALILRRTHPEWRRPFRVPWFPWVPIASLLATLFLMATVARSNPAEAIAGSLIVLSGIPVWLIYRGRAQALRTASSTEGQALESGSIRSK
jgi:APA family basic amino acid/polyamine antiporter